jgi:riboflavin kinase / FMN adenylyltransferase
MTILTWEELGSGSYHKKPIAAAIGVFDGLHIGHRELVGRVLGREGLSSAVVTFEDNPKRILSPSTFHGELSTLDQRLALIQSMGVDLCVLIDFSGDFSKLPGRRFLSILSEGGELRYLAVGSNFRCGYRLDTDSAAIREFCVERSIEVELLSAVQWAGHPVSSSRIRKAVREGRLQDAECMLGRPYEIDLHGAHPLSSGRLLPKGGQASPPPGSYEAIVASPAGWKAGDVSSGDGLAVVAELGNDGAWSFSGPAGAGTRDPAPIGMRIVRVVSRE